MPSARLLSLSHARIVFDLGYFNLTDEQTGRVGCWSTPSRGGVDAAAAHRTAATRPRSTEYLNVMIIGYMDLLVRSMLSLG